ncbi:MAG: 7TM diverse intracellular signaling domain-containing protein, partial [Shewanella sp.]
MFKSNTSCILLLWLWMCSTPSFATLLSINESSATPLNLTPWLMVNHSVSPKELTEILILPQSDWHLFSNKDTQKLSSHDFWLNFSLTSQDGTLARILALDNPLLDKVTIYHLVNNQLANTVLMGDTLPYNERPFLSNIFLYPFKLNMDDTHTFYLHIQTEGSASVPLNLWSSNDLAQIAESTAVEHGFQLGVLAAIGIFSLFIAIASGSFSYSYYSGYVLSMTLLVATINGFAFRYLWPNWPILQKIMVPLLLPTVMAFALMFTEKILQLKYLNRRMLLTCRYSTVYIICVGLATPFIQYSTALYIQIISVAVLSLVLMLFAMTQAINGHKLARMYSVGWVSMLTGACISSLLYPSIIDLNVKPQTPVMLGLTFEILFMSLVLAIRYNDERKAKLRIQQEALKQAQKIRSAREDALKAEADSNEKLEQMVQERTLELEVTLRELHDVNQKLTEQSTI